jgi:uncharacterized membrane protein YfcA
LTREALAVLFAVLLTYAGSTMVRRVFKKQIEDPVAGEGYQVRHLPLGLMGAGAAGTISGMLGVGGGVIKVPLMYLVMGIPFKVATATSNFMIGVTAAASAFIYYARGDVRSLITAPTALGVFVGASVGAHWMRRTPSRWLVTLFAGIVFYFAALMIWKALHGGFAR